MRYLKDLLKRRDLPIWQMPVAYAREGADTYTLAQLVELKPEIKAPETLTLDEWRELVLAQISFGIKYEKSNPGRPRYQLASPDGFIQGFEQAMAEIEKSSHLGETVLRNRTEFIKALLMDIYGENRT